MVMLMLMLMTYRDYQVIVIHFFSVKWIAGRTVNRIRSLPSGSK